MLRSLVGSEMCIRDRARLVSALVLSRLDYCNAILVGLPQTTLSSLHASSVQQHDWSSTCDRSTTSLQCCLSYTGYRLPQGSTSNCLLVHKALVGHTPRYIVDLITPVAHLPSRPLLRTALGGDLYVPRTRRKLRDRAFAIAAPRVWNSLPTDIKLHRLTTTSFKRHLKTVLFHRTFADHM